jgi:hypothetical protein
MQYFEANFINQIYVTSPYYPLRPLSLSMAVPRREIADPEKLACIAVDTQRWEPYEYADDMFYMKKITWNKQFRKFAHKSVEEGHFYVLCRNTALFSSKYDDLSAWLEVCSQIPFVITTSVYTCGTERYGITNSAHIRSSRVPLLGHDELTTLMFGHCYTICNGLTYALAMHRLRKICAQTAVQGFMHFLSKHDIDSLYQHVPLPFMKIYYGHSAPHIADFPWYYAHMGPKFVDPRVAAMFGSMESDVFPHVIRHNVVALTSFKTIMLPNFNRAIWDQCVNLYTGKPDIYGYFIAVGCHRSCWKWWLQNPQILVSWIHAGYLYPVLLNSFILYNNDTDQGQLVRKRLKHIWTQTIEISGISTILMFTSLLIKDAPVSFIILAQSYVPNLSQNLMASMKIVGHPYLNVLYSRITLRLNVLYTIFGLGKRKEPFTSSSLVGRILIEYLKSHRDVLMC